VLPEAVFARSRGTFPSRFQGDRLSNAPAVEHRRTRLPRLVFPQCSSGAGSGQPRHDPDLRNRPQRHHDCQLDRRHPHRPAGGLPTGSGCALGVAGGGSYVEIFHNRRRRHPALGMRTPIEYDYSTPHQQPPESRKAAPPNRGSARCPPKRGHSIIERGRA
jgi:hypothetical protein